MPSRHHVVRWEGFPPWTCLWRLVANGHRIPKWRMTVHLDSWGNTLLSCVRSTVNSTKNRNQAQTTCGLYQWCQDSALKRYLQGTFLVFPYFSDVVFRILTVVAITVMSDCEKNCSPRKLQQTQQEYRTTPNNQDRILYFCPTLVQYPSNKKE